VTKFTSNERIHREKGGGGTTKGGTRGRLLERYERTQVGGGSGVKRLSISRKVGDQDLGGNDTQLFERVTLGGSGAALGARQLTGAWQLQGKKEGGGCGISIHEGELRAYRPGS